jgi:hypothetical protein
MAIEFWLDLLRPVQPASRGFDAQAWNQIRTVIISAVGTLATAAIAITSLIASRRREREQIEREDRRRRVERVFVPRAEYDVDCRFYGPY